MTEEDRCEYCGRDHYCDEADAEIKELEDKVKELTRGDVEYSWLYKIITPEFEDAIIRNWLQYEVDTATSDGEGSDILYACKTLLPYVSVPE